MRPQYICLASIALLASIRTSVSAQQSPRTALIAADAALSDSVSLRGLERLADALGSAGILVWPGQPVVRGRADAAPVLSGSSLLDSIHLAWQPLRVELSGDSTLATLLGVATLRRPAHGDQPSIERIGRYLAVWRRNGSSWTLNAFAVANLIATGELPPPRRFAEWPVIHSDQPAGPFVAADSSFAADAGVGGASAAFGKWAASDGMTLSGTGELNIGPAKISAALAGNRSKWEWAPVAAGSSPDGELGWTVGLATITPADGGSPFRSKYLTLWRKQPNGTIRFIADGGNARP